MRIVLRIGLAVATIAMQLAVPAHGLDVTSCGQVVPRLEAAQLVADLACAGDGTPAFDAAVTLEAGATLDLAGHRIEMAHDGYALVGVDCSGRCTVTSSAATPGEIVGTGAIGTSGAGVFVSANGRGRITNVRIERFVWGIWGTGALNLRDVTVANNAGDGAISLRTLRAVDTAATGNAAGGLRASRSMSVVRTTASGNYLAGLSAQRRVRAVEVEVSGNGWYGIESWDGQLRGSIALRSSTVTGNGSPDLGSSDLVSGRRPRLVDTSCGTSRVAYSGDTWGVCSGD